MLIISWNVRGLNAHPKRAVVKEFRVKFNPDVVILQETKLSIVDRQLVKSVWSSRFVGWASLEACGSSGGILILWKEDSLTVDDSIQGEFSVSIHCKLNAGFCGWITGVYGPSAYRRREQFWMELSSLYGLCNDNWCVGGDFNVVRWLNEKSSGTRPTRSMLRFNNLIEEMDLVDIPFRNGRFSWSRSGVRPTASKIDRFLLSKPWMEFFREVSVERLPRTTSDHFPIILKMGAHSWGPIPFRFENAWLDHHLFFKNIENWWGSLEADGWPIFSSMEKLKGLKAILKSWNKETFGNIFSQKQVLIDKINSFDSLEE